VLTSPFFLISRLEETVDASERLKEQGGVFQRLSRKQKCMERRRNIFWTIVLAICCLVRALAPSRRPLSVLVLRHPGFVLTNSVWRLVQILLGLIVGIIVLIVYKS
jgi:hypothetical protein